MCELFAMSSRKRSSVTYSLDEFARHGGLTYRNRSGWGIAYFHDREAFIVKEPEPAHDSPWVRFIAEQELESRFVIAHVRLATVGEPKLHNTHPFRRALGGQVHVFAHNGTLHGLHDAHGDAHLFEEPVGDTDSELAFCLLMERMVEIWHNKETAPDIDARLDVFAGFASDMRGYGSSNFLYSDGDALYVHADKRVYEEGEGYSEPRAPGLSMRNCVACQSGPEFVCEGLKVGMEDQRTTLFASVPLDETGWEPLPEGTAIVVLDGEELARVAT